VLTGLSHGEIVDRLAVLRIRSWKHVSETQQRLAEWELGILLPQLDAIGLSERSVLWRWLLACNLRIWEVVTLLKKMAAEGQQREVGFTRLSMTLVKLENLRIGIKDRINRRTGSVTLEVKDGDEH